MDFLEIMGVDQFSEAEEIVGDTDQARLDTTIGIDQDIDQAGQAREIENVVTGAAVDDALLDRSDRRMAMATTSSPAPASIVSIPPLPLMISLPEVPDSTSLPEVPVMVAMEETRSP